MLGDGRVVDLENTRLGETVSNEEGIIGTRTEHGIAYAPAPDSRKSQLLPSQEGATTALPPVRQTTHMLSIGRGISYPFEISYADGCKVWVNHGSQYVYPTGGLHNGQLSTLNGQAWFAIAPDESYQPAEVRTIRNDTLSVLGTSFSVESFSGDTHSRVELYSGKVRVRSRGENVLLHPDSLVVFAEGEETQVSRMGVHQAMPAWMRPPAKSPYFEFRNTPLAVALHEVATEHLLDWANPYHIKGIPISGKLLRDQPLEITLRALERVQSGHAVLRKKADTLLILPSEAGP